MTAAILEAAGPAVIAASSGKSDSNNIQYNVGVDLNLILHWKTEATTEKEKEYRKRAQQDFDYKAQLLAHEIVMHLNE